MPQARMLSKKISHDEKVASLSLAATLLYTWCIPYLDVKGRIHGDCWSLKGIVPHIDELTPQKIDNCVDEFVSTDLVISYGDKQKYLQFNGFFNHQKVYADKEARSVIPEPTQDELQSNSGVNQNHARTSKVKESKVKESKDAYRTHVLLSEIEIKNLIELMGGSTLDIYAENLDDYIGSTGKSYKSHYHTIRSWYRRDKSDNKIPKSGKSKSQIEVEKTDAYLESLK